MTVFIVAGLAAAKTSAGAPALIWVARVALEPKLKVTLLPDRPSKSVPIWVNASVSEAAANTVIGAAGADELPEVAGSGLSVPHAVRSSRVAAASRARRTDQVMGSPGSRRRHGWT